MAGAKKKDISGLIGQKLLQGWTMLGEVCPNDSCPGVPLMRDSQKKMLCVNCDVFYVRDGDYDSSKHKLTTTPASSSAAAPAPASTSKLAAKDNSDFDEQIEALLDEEIEAYAEQERQRLSAREAALLQASASVGPSPSSLSLLNSKATVSATISTLVSKLALLQKRLQDATDLSDIKAVSETIHSVAQSLLVLKQL